MLERKEEIKMAGRVVDAPVQPKSPANVYSQTSNQIEDAIRKVNSVYQQNVTNKI